MKGIARFYTLFWILYFPLCIAFYDSISFQYIDEILTVVLIGYTFINVKPKGNKGKFNEMWIYILVMAMYVVYSLVMAVNVSSAVWLDLQQQVRPYAVFYCTWLLAPKFTNGQKKMILNMMGLTIAAYILLGITGRLSFYGQAFITPVTGQLALVMAMTYFCFKPATKKNVFISVLILTIGLLSAKSKFFGEYVVFIAIAYFLHERIKFASLKTFLQLSVLVGAVVFFTWEKFNAYYVEGFEEERLQELARPATYATGIQILNDYAPFGPGLGTFACNAAAEHYSPLYERYGLNEYWGLTEDNPMFLTDCFYPVLAQYGWVGVFLFCIFWYRRIRETKYIIDDRYYKMALMCILALALESTADTSYLSGKGMGFFMLLAICLNERRTMVKG